MSVDQPPGEQSESASSDAMTPEERMLLERLRTMVLEDPVWEPLSEERRVALRKEIDAIAVLANAIGRPWYIAGGTALDLGIGDFRRDHQDTDVAVMQADGTIWFDELVRRGYVFHRPVEEDQYSEYRSRYGTKDPDVRPAVNGVHWVTVSGAEEFVHGGENAFPTQRDPHAKLPKQFEIMLLRADDRGDIQFGGDVPLSFPRALYEQAVTVSAEHGARVSLQPREVVLLHKITDGRQKDLEDLRTFLPMLAPDERERLDGYLRTLGATFTDVSSGHISDTLDALLRESEATERVAREQLADELPENLQRRFDRYRAVPDRMSVTEEITQDVRHRLQEMRRWNVQFHR